MSGADSSPGARSESDPDQSRSSLKHDLRTPLNHIIGYCEMLLEEAADQRCEVIVGDLQRIHSAGRRLLTVINDLFDPDKRNGPADESLLHHEIRTPLNQIIGYSEMLQEDSGELGHFAADVNKIETAARSLLALVVEKLVPAVMGGNAELRPAPEEGTSFLVRPVAGEVPALASGLAGSPSEVLVVDDNELNRDMLVRRLERLGHRVTPASNGREAMTKLRDGSFDLVLLDILMPEMNGYEVLEAMKRQAELREVPVIVLSASDDTASVARCVGMGAEDYLTKPFDPVLLQARISALLEKKRLRDQQSLFLQQIQLEKERADNLLRIILPHEVAEELKATQSVKPRRFERVGVLFCDVVGFTAYCDQHPPDEVHQHLQRLVEELERITVHYSLEKIKTIGDSFMAAGGLLAPLDNPALSCVRCGIEMIQAAVSLPPHWQVRVGVNVGPVIAGVVGKNKYQYDVWGDTVNVASRMEKAAVPGFICVNAETWKQIEAQCHGRSEGELGIKGKGKQQVYRVERLK